MFTLLTQDMRYGVRTLAKTPGFTLVALITLALGIGATTTVFSIVKAVLFTPPSFQDAERLVGLFTANPGRGMHRLSTSSEDFSDWRGQSRAFVDMGLYLFDACNLTGGDRPARALRVRASASLLPVLGFDARIGRRFGPEHDDPREQQVVLLSDTFWQKRFGADPDVIGETLLLDNVPYSILGVLPPELERAWSNFDVWIPLAPGPEMLGRGNRWFDVYGRLKPGVSLTRAQSEMREVAARLEQMYPSSNKGHTVEVIPIMDLMIGSSSKSALLMLSLSAACVLLISCTNVAGLLLARGTARQREYAIRSAIGATSARLTCQLMTESAVLALVSGALGVGLAIGGIRILVYFLSNRIGQPGEITIDGAVLLFTLVISLVAALLFGIAPASRISRVGTNEALQEGGQSTSPSQRKRYARESLVVAQLALALALVICAGLMIKSLLVLQSVDPGFDTQRLLTMRLTLPGGTYDSERKRAAFFEEVLERIRSVRGVQSAAAASVIPLVGRDSESQVTVEDYVPPNDPNGGPMVGNTVVTPAYFRTLGIPIVRGRDFTGISSSEATSVIIVNKCMAERFWPGEDAIGKRLKFSPRDSDRPWLTVIGVAGDVKQISLTRDIRFETYRPHAQIPAPSMTIVARTAAKPLQVTSAVENAIWTLDPDLAIYRTRSMEDVVRSGTRGMAALAALLGTFGTVAMLLASVGLYGVMSFAVSTRTQEIGIRMALGAQSRDVIRMILHKSAAVTMLGTGAGIGLALLIGRVLEGLMFGVTPTDPGTFVVVTSLLMGVAAVASYLPARRATKVDPVVALRH